MSIQPYNPEKLKYSDADTRLAFEDWATLPMVRIVKILQTSEEIFNYRGIAIMAKCSLGTAHSSIKTLVEKGYLIEINGNFQIKTGRVQRTEQISKNVQPTEHDVQPVEQNVQYTEQNVQPTEPNNILNNNLLKINYEENIHSPSETKFYEIAKEAFENDPSKYQNDNRFINAGLRPLRKYPKIWISVRSLCDVLETYEQVGIPIDSRKIHHLAFKNVQAKLEIYEQEGKSTKNVSCYSWLTGFAMQEVLDTLTKSNRLKKSEAT